jgi:hypothetical protein
MKRLGHVKLIIWLLRNRRKLELSLFDQFKLKGAKIWMLTFLPLYLFLFGDKYKPVADFFADAAVSENQIINFTWPNKITIWKYTPWPEEP